MRCNVGRKERLVRTFIGLAVLGAGVLFESWWGLLGLIPLATAAIGWCPLSAVMGVNTCKEENVLPTDTTGGGTHQPIRMREMEGKDRTRHIE
jgi:hypothetical protein